MGHVIIDFEWTAVCEGFVQKAGLTGEKFAPILKHLGSLGYETGKINTAFFLNELNRLLGTNIDESEFTNLWNATFRENLEVTQMLTKLKQSYKLYLLSNTNENHYNWIQQQYNVARHFEELILSYEIGHAKPDHPIYSEVMTRSGFDAAQCVFVDDLHENVRAARDAGMHGIVFTTAEQLRVDLAKLNVHV